MTTGGVTVSKEGEPRSDGDRPSCGAARLGPSGWVPEGGGRVRVAGRLIAVAVLVSALVALAAPSPALASAAGQLYAFGDNQYGQLGSATNNGTTTPNPTLTLVGLPGQTGPVAQVAAGFTHSLAVTSTGQLYAFGENYYGQLGIATNTGTTNANPPGAGGVAGSDRPGGAGRRGVYPQSGGDLDRAAVRVWRKRVRGAGQHDQQRHDQREPDPALVGLPGQTGPVVQVAAGASHSLAVTSTGQLYAFGDNQYGQLGSTTNNGTANPNPTPVLVGLPGQTGPVVQVAAGYDHSLAVTSTGQLYAFGYNEDGQLGNVTSGDVNPIPLPVGLPGQTGPVVQVAAGAYHSLALTSTGQLYAFGENYFGQLGNATNNGNFNPNPAPVLVGLPGQTGPVVQVAAGYTDSLAVTSTGQLYVFGENDFGELGNAANSGTDSANPTPVLVGMPGGVSVDTVARGLGGRAFAGAARRSVGHHWVVAGRDGGQALQRVASGKRRYAAWAVVGNRAGTRARGRRIDRHDLWHPDPAG